MAKAEDIQQLKDFFQKIENNNYLLLVGTNFESDYRSKKSYVIFNNIKFNDGDDSIELTEANGAHISTYSKSVDWYIASEEEPHAPTSMFDQIFNPAHQGKLIIKFKVNGILKNTQTLIAYDNSVLAKREKDLFDKKK